MKDKVTCFAVKSGEIIEVSHLRGKWWENIHTGEEMLISERNIFKARYDAEQSLSARIKAKQDKEQRLLEECLAEEQRRDQIFRENPWLLEVEVPFAFMLADDLEEYVRRFSPKK